MSVITAIATDIAAAVAADIVSATATDISTAIANAVSTYVSTTSLCDHHVEVTEMLDWQLCTRTVVRFVQGASSLLGLKIWVAAKQLKG